MKNFGRVTLIIGIILLCSATSYGQKFGYINSQELVTTMPELDTINSQLKRLQKDFSDQLEAIQVEFNTKLQDYQKNVSSSAYTASVAKLKEQELAELQKRFTEFQEVADQDLQEMQTKLMTPVIERAQEAIKKVSKDNGFTMVYDLSTGALLYYDEATVVNILPLVQKELGITAKVATPATAVKK